MPSSKHLFRFWALAVFSVGLSAMAEDRLSLFHKMQTALGGADRIAAVIDREQIETATTWSADGKIIGQVVKRERWIRPNILRLDQEGPDDTYVLYFDGNAGWEILPTSGEKKVISLVGGELEFARKYLRGEDFNSWLADRDPRYRITSPGPNVIRLADSSDANIQGDTVLDPATWLPAKTISISLADPAHPVPSEARIEGWRTVQGLRFPLRTVVFRSGVRAAEITLKKIQINKGLKRDNLAQPPSDMKPVISE